MVIAKWLASLHPLLVQFPVVLWLTALVADAIGFFRRDARFDWAGRLLLLAGTAAAGIAGVSGVLAQIYAVRMGILEEATEVHERWAILTIGWFVALTALRLFFSVHQRSGRERRLCRSRFWARQGRRALPVAYLLAGLLGALMLTYTGNLGGKLVFKYGAAVEAICTKFEPSDEHLQLLAARQSLADRAYSEWMHHVFGWVVLGIAACSVLTRFRPQVTRLIARGIPLLFFGGGIFLFIFSDPDAFPLDNKRSLLNLEVLFHKVTATGMVIAGLIGLWRRQEWRLPPGEYQNRITALVALVGGALLFTHIHQVGPYSDVAAGVYVQHALLGIIALMIGFVKLFEDLIRKPAHWKAWFFPALLTLQAFLLITYNEGPPWFLGYHPRLDSKGPHGGLIQQVEGKRAEFVFNPESLTIDLYLLELERNRPWWISARQLNGAIRVGTESTAIKLVAADSRSNGASHFRAKAPFLRGVKLFTPVVTIPKSCPMSRAPCPVWHVEFEPWVAWQAGKKLAVAAPLFVCPMMPELGGFTKPGPCPLCGMPLVPGKSRFIGASLAHFTCPQHPTIGSGKPSLCGLCGRRLKPNRLKMNTLHSWMYDCTLKVEPHPAPAGAPVRLKLTPVWFGKKSIIQNLENLRGHFSHVYIVKKDLSSFAHVHPVRHKDGSMTLTHTFPSGGDYVLFADYVPKGGMTQVFRFPLSVNRKLGNWEAEKLARWQGSFLISQSPNFPTDGKLIKGYQVALYPQPSPPLPGDENHLLVRISKDGKPVTDLQPLEGAPGLCVLISGDTNWFEWCHPLGGREAFGGPELRFHAVFPKPGLYKLWVQFKHRGKIITTDFPVEVP